MARTTTVVRSFAGGEMSPDMYGRIGDAKYQTGAAKMRNFIPTAQGPVRNRPGFEYVRDCRVFAGYNPYKVRLIPFVFSRTQTMVIEFGHNYCRFHTNGSTLLAPISTIPAWSDGTTYTYGQIVSHNDAYYSSRDQFGTSNQTPGETVHWHQMQVDGTNAIYEIWSPYLETELFDLRYVQSFDVITITHSNHEPQRLIRKGATEWAFFYIGETYEPPRPSIASIVVNAAGADPTTFQEAKYVATVVMPTISDRESRASYQTSSTKARNNLFQRGANNTITINASSWQYNNIYKAIGGIYGYIGRTEAQTGALTFIDDGIYPDLSRSPPYRIDRFDVTNEKPTTIAYYQQRLCYAGTLTNPLTTWMSRPGDALDFSYRLPLRDDDRVKFTIDSRDGSIIRHLIPLDSLIILTAESEWSVKSNTSNTITPTSIDARPQSYIGASNVQPVVIGNSVIFASERGNHLYNLHYSFEANGYVSNDLCLRASHLFDNKKIVDMAYSQTNVPIVWAVSDDGKLLGMTYIASELINAFHWHDLYISAFESCCVVSEGNEDRLYVVIREGTGQVSRYIARLGSLNTTTREKSIYLDKALSFDFSGDIRGQFTINSLAGNLPNIITPDTEGVEFAIHSASKDYTYSPGDHIIVYYGRSSFKFEVISTIVGETRSFQSEKLLRVKALENINIVAITKSRWQIRKKRIVGGLKALGLSTLLVSYLIDGFAGTGNLYADNPALIDTDYYIDLPQPAKQVLLGLPYQSDLETLPAIVQTDGYGLTDKKNVVEATLKVKSSSGILVGTEFDNNMKEPALRTTEPYGSPVALKTGDIDLLIGGQWSTEGKVCIRQSDPLPLEILGLYLEMEVAN